MINKKILVSGVKPTGKLHIGNYFGALKQFVDLQDQYDNRIFIADLHALTSQQDSNILRKDIQNMLLDYLAIGLDPQKVTLYKQSDIPEVAELSWIFSCITTMPYLMRAHAFKDSEAKNKEINVGVYNYPLLMAADILLPGADVVPVGKDQKQHVEIARDTAVKFNRIFNETFKSPQEIIIENVMTVPGIDGQKMSKSYGNTIELFAEDDDIKKAVMSIVTDSKSPDESKDPETDNIFALHKLFTEDSELEDLKRRYDKGGIGYKESKEILLKNITSFITPLREKRKELEKDKDLVRTILHEGKNKIRPIVEEKMNEIRENVGLTIK
ncbi:MAG: tryptophan--tRNA ligase [bacterium]|nr:tryptophan--tRNA ligase [bacterium]